ncbi:undecaprenyl-diphosphate phosphatase [Jatrophihabitans lederbergiae]|uniref:Undecaprenyl-diphosphatase n=1 Tax=Jatrophihabitans lederbergiae TaxID=3075547 RepID=A0ABU2JCW5_9ACTN|nr:undecaprenyl-diphosphate phosphatase [Jatrophihabitans sp. DSM 44399]MDT0262830.1 undecaprenyl-diphosphate phosphatase [Jatrophihabitans sp. DSM 44399]
MSAGVSVGQAALYGVVQGLTEFLPISSTAHLRIVQAWMNPGVDQAGFTAFTAVIQLGTVVAVVLFFWRELLHVALAWGRGLVDKSVRHTLEYRMGWYLILATIPVGVFGLVFKDQIKTGARNLWLIATALIVMALILLVAERRGSRSRSEEEITTQDALVVGTAQALALIPGVSRSGATITAGLFRGLDRVTAARFSFLLSIPAVVASGLFELKDIGGAGAPGMGVTVVATLISFVVGLASIAWLIRYISRHSTFIFVGYRIALGALLLVLLSTGALSAT